MQQLVRGTVNVKKLRVSVHVAGKRMTVPGRAVKVAA